MNCWSRQSRFVVYSVVVVFVALIASLDYLTGYEVALFSFYALPILIAVGRGDLSAAIGIAVVSAILWWMTDRASGHHYSREWLRLWDCFIRFTFFCLVIVAGILTKSRAEANKVQIELLRKTQTLEAEIVGICEREQQRIGHDLHDDLCQYLASARFLAAGLEEKIEKSVPELTPRVAELAAMIEVSVLNARQLARGLSPVDCDEGGIESALETLAKTTARRTGIFCSFIGQPSEVLIDNETAVEVFRIAQEAVNNAAKHARAKSIVIAIESSGDDITLRVSDNGVGLNLTGKQAGGMGMNIMRYRARRIGASLEFLENAPSGVIVGCCLRGNRPLESSST
jgi:signal transduction histidine kinase